MDTQPGIMSKSLVAAAVGLLLAPVCGAVADSVYKTVDESGTVSYSSSPAGDAVQSESVSIPQPPTEAQRREARKIERQIQSTSKRTTQSLQRDQRQSRQQIVTAEARLKAARAALEKAQIKTDADWQNLAQGGRHLKESYFQRVEAAEAAVRQAELELAKAKRDVR